MKLESLALHHGYSAEKTTKSAAVPVYQTASYSFDDTKHGADLFNLEVEGNIYSRMMNPTCDVLEQRIAAMEGGVAALAVASGMAAITYAIECLCVAGDNIISASQLYGGTYNLFAHSMPKKGIEVRMISFNDYAGLELLIDEKTRAIYCESIGNPAGNIVDIEKLATIAHRHGLPLIVDNTVATPYLCRPIELGADIIVHSLTKYIGGHGTTIGGAIVDSGQFDWKAQENRFPQFSTPDPSYHGVVCTDAFGPAAFIGRCRIGPLRNTGAALSPMNAFLIMQGLETLGLRMDKHCENAQAVAQFLLDHPKVSWVNYASLPNSPFFGTCEKITGGRASGLLSFGIKGGHPAGAAFIDSLKMILRLVNIGDAKSLACHPASTTHRQLSAEELAFAGVSEDLVRLSVGIEHLDDIIADIKQALDAVPSEEDLKKAGVIGSSLSEKSAGDATSTDLIPVDGENVENLAKDQIGENASEKQDIDNSMDSASDKQKVEDKKIIEAESQPSESKSETESQNDDVIKLSNMSEEKLRGEPQQLSTDKKEATSAVNNLENETELHIQQSVPATSLSDEKNVQRGTAKMASTSSASPKKKKKGFFRWLLGLN